MPPPSDHHLIQITDDAFADAARRSGEWLVCRPACSQCCTGAFAISQLDALRLQQSLDDLTAADPVRAQRIRDRIHASAARLASEFPGDPASGTLDDSPEAQSRFDEFANDEVCPILDPSTQTCDLYAARPMTCRTFGPPVRSGGDNALGHCELCYHGATDQEIAACEMLPDPDGLEAPLIAAAEESTGKRGSTVIAFTLH